MKGGDYKCREISGSGVCGNIDEFHLAHT